MKSLHGRRFLLTAGAILISLALPGTAFIGLSYQCTIRETRDSMKHNADYMTDFTAKVQAEGTDMQDMAHQLYVASVVYIVNTSVLVIEADGELVLRSDRATIQSELERSYLPQSIVSQLQKEDGYSGMTTLSGPFPEKRFMAGTSITVKMVNLAIGQTEQTIIGVAYVAVEISSIAELWRAFIFIFFPTTIVVPCVAFIANSITSLRLTSPLKGIVEIARKSGHGEHEVRVQGYEKQEDEVGELVEVFNAMADSIVKSEVRHNEFTTNISHELKASTTTITGFSDGILGGTIPPDKEHVVLRTISSGTRQFSRLVWWMLGLFRLQSAENITAQEQFDVSETMPRVPISLENKANTRHLDVGTQLPDGPVLVWGDPDTIAQMYYNLLNNVIRFSTERSTMDLSITARRGKAYVAVCNHDNTISPDELAMIFDRFHKSGKSRSMGREGVGLGLYIVRIILSNHKENISVTSQDGVAEFVPILTFA